MSRHMTPAPAGLKHCPCPEHEGDNPLPVSGFSKSRGKSDGLGSWCKACTARANRRRNAANPGEIRESRRRRYAANPGKQRQANRRWDAANPERRRELDDRKRQLLRNTVFDHYGHACACCGAAENLAVDHVNGDGTAHRMELFGRNTESTGVYRWLVKNSFPEGFQVLCKPCNSSKGSGPACRLDHAGAGSPGLSRDTIRRQECSLTQSTSIRGHRRS